MRVYISGPMRGIPEYNFPAFDGATAAMRQAGFDVISPAEHDREVDPLCHTRPGYALGLHEDGTGGGLRFQDLIGWDLEQLARPGYIDAIALLPGWENSTGVAHELYVSRVTGKKVMYLIPQRGSWTWYDESKPANASLLVGLSGYAQAGKDTAARVLIEHFGFKRVAFADALRDVLYALNPMVDVIGADGMPDGVWAVQALVDQIGWEQAKASGPAWSEFTVRKLLQRLGTEAGRQVLGDNIWVDTAMRQVDGLMPGEVKYGGRYVITDVRFPNEYQAIKQRGGQVWRIVRPGTEPVNAHPSETALDRYSFDASFINDGSILEFDRNVHRAMSIVFGERARLGAT